MNNHVNKNKVRLIEIMDIGDGQIQAFTKLPFAQAANIMFNLAINFIRLDEKQRLLKEQSSNLINPHTGNKIIQAN